ncbi:hypothetical protein VNI00_002023 [Paramarasmius palmivorus]|uniref:Uncharacterized protein n=1 Tax=Paramarasmius palmivorus TaxID=297713 RepID=A0AAW0E3E0_9AGAR
MNQCWDADALSRPDTDKIKHYLWSLFGPIESPPPWNLTISKHIWVNVRGTDMPSDRQVAAFLSQSYERLEIRRHQLLSPEQGLCTSTLSQARTPQQQPSLSISPWTQGNLLYDPVAASSMATLPPPEGTDAPTGTEESFGSLDSASLPVSFSSPYDGTSRGVNRSGSDDTTLGSADSHSPMMYDQSSLLPGYHQHPPPTITSSKAPVDDNASGYQTQVHRDERSARNRAIHIRRLFELCQVGIGHASLLADVLLTTTPEEVVNGSQPLVVEFREKCLSNMKLITAQMPWTIASAERSRREKDALQKQASTGEGANEDFDEQTTEEKLLTGLLEANVQLTRTIKQYNDLGTEVLERKVEEEGERDVGMDKNVSVLVDFGWELFLIVGSQAIDGIDQRPSSSDGSSGATPLLNATERTFEDKKYTCLTVRVKEIIKFRPAMGTTASAGPDSLPQTSMSTDELSSFFTKAWGKTWPRRSGTIFKTDICKENTTLMEALDDETPGNRYGAVYLEIQDQFDYICYEGISAVGKALKMAEEVHDVLVIQSEFSLLRESIECRKNRHKGQKQRIVVTGQPGIGKTAFLLYLLIHRLERKLPTAVQCNNDAIIVFNETGFHTHSTDDILDLRNTGVHKVLKECWAFAANVTQPFLLFQVYAQCLIQAAPPNTYRWRGWLKQFEGSHFVMDLPQVMEITAIVKERGLDVSSTVSLVRKWGPSTRTIIRILAEAGIERDFETDAAEDARKICLKKLVLSDLAVPGSSRKPDESVSCTLVFIRPKRVLAPDGTIRSSLAVPFIPTQYLGEVFETARTKLPNTEAFQVFCTLNSYSRTKTPNLWQRERNMHIRLMTGGPGDVLGIRSLDGQEMQMMPSNRLLMGTAAGLKAAAHYESFYWIPSVIETPGIDGVLADTDNIYALQAAIMAEHGGSPKDGIRALWRHLDTDIRESRTWHFVVVGLWNGVTELMRMFEDHLASFTLGDRGIQIHVWGCVL